MARKPPSEHHVAIGMAAWGIGLISYGIAVKPRNVSVIGAYATILLLVLFGVYEALMLRYQRAERRRIAEEAATKFHEGIDSESGH